MANERQRQENRIRQKEQTTRRRYHIVLFLVMAALILLLDVIFILLPDKEASETENRTLQQFPKLNFTTVTNGRFETRFDQYVADQFPARDTWVSMKSTVDIMSGKTESNHIFLGKDGYLIQDLTLPSEEKYQENMEKIRVLKEANPELSFSALIAPTALSVLKDHLPANAVTGDEEGFFEQVKTDIKQMGIDFVDVREVLKEAAKEDQVYYRTDHHWTTFGAYTAYQLLAEAKNLPGRNTAYSAELASDSFRGTLTASSGFRTGETDKIYVYLPETEQEYSVMYVSEGKRTASFYHTDNLNVRDHYTLFFNGNHPEVRIETSADSQKTLLVIKDSYANCFVPFLAGDYRKILMVDPRYYTDDLNALIRSENVTDVLYLYHIGSFAE